MHKKIFNEKILSQELKALPHQIPKEHAAIIETWTESIKNKSIKKQNETALHGHFIQKILIEILNYQGFSDGNNQWNLSAEESIGSGNVDVALGTFQSNGKKQIIAPFELKGAKTVDLDALMTGRHKSPVQQAWKYANNNKGTQWVLVSNYTEIRLYNYNLGTFNYERFDLAQLYIEEEYQRFVLLLSADNLLTGKTLELLEKSEKADKEITDELYKDYKEIRQTLITTLTEENPNINQLEIITLSQLILDRILFIAFAEDKKLLPDKIIAKAYETKNQFNPQPIWHNFLGLFQAIDKGNDSLNIPKYNGGLFKYNLVLENLKIPDRLCESFRALSTYDFDSEISVNILGHIFEQSISDIEEIKAKTKGEDFDKKQSKRKQDGVFYTPSYITRYITEQTVGRWIEDRKKELGYYLLPKLKEKDYENFNPKKPKVKIKKHLDFWIAYKKTLSNIKVLDPACGSGAFLNEVFDYLLVEGAKVNREIAQLQGGQGELFRWDTHILANNIFGVDINPESVEITKLGLWLKTASKKEPLTYLESNIKVGNSLIDDPMIAGDFAFNWQNEFKNIMSDGGFDVIVGNPPYGAKLSKEDKEYLKTRYQTTEYNVETYISFFELSLTLLKDNSYLGFITPNTYLVTENSTQIRELILKKNTLLQLLEIFNVFRDAIVEPITSIIKICHPKPEHKISVTTTERSSKDIIEKLSTARLLTFDQKEIERSPTLIFNYRSEQELRELASKIKKHAPLKEIASVTTGVKPYQTGKGKPAQTSNIVKEKPFTSNEKKDENWLALTRGTNIHRYLLLPTDEYIHYGNWLAEPRTAALFINPKIIIRRTDDTLMAVTDSEKVVGINSVHCIQLNNDNTVNNLYWLLALINSKLINWVFQFDNFHMVGKPLAEVKVIFVERLPIVELSSSNKDILAKHTLEMLNLTSNLSTLSSRFTNLIQTRLNLEKLTKRLGNWYELSFHELKAELKKKKVSLSLADEAEWLQYFTEQKSLAEEIMKAISSKNDEIDEIVYDLYGLEEYEKELIRNK